MKRVTEDIEHLQIPAGMIYAAEMWAKRELFVDEPDVQWIIRVAWTLSHFGHQAEALERWCLARSMDSNNWMVDLLHTKIQRGQQEYEACLQTALALAERFRASKSLKKEFACSWKEVLRTIADAHHYLDNHQASIEASWRLLNEFPNDYKFIMTMVERLDERGNFRVVITLLERLGTRRPIERQKQQNGNNNNKSQVEEEQEEDNDNESGGLTKLTALYHALACFDDFDSSFDSFFDFHCRVARAARATNSTVVVHKAFCDAIAAAEAPPSPSSTITSSSPDEGKTTRFSILAALRYYYARTLLHHGSRQNVGDADADNKKAVELLECNLLPNKLKSPATYSWTLCLSARALSSLYLHYAKSTGFRSPELDQWTKKLRALVDVQASSDGEGLIETSLVLGRLLHLGGRESEAREAVRAHVRVVLNLLDDDDPKNDAYAYLILGETLGPLDDDVNALAAWGLIRPSVMEEKKEGEEEGSGENKGGGEGGDKGGETVEQDKGVEEHAEQNDSNNDGVGQEKAETEPLQSISTSDADVDGPKSSTDNGKHATPTSSENGTAAATIAGDGEDGEGQPPPSLEGPLGNTCDGNCNKEWAYADDIYVCKDCIDVQFCAVCVDKLRAGTLERQICGRDHAFLHVPRWTDIAAADKAAGRVPDGFMRVGDEVLAIKDWINGIRVKWGFAKVD